MSSFEVLYLTKKGLAQSSVRLSKGIGNCFFFLDRIEEGTGRITGGEDESKG